MKDSNNNINTNNLQRQLKFLNVVRVFPEHLDFTIAEIRRQHEEVGLTDFALSLSFHPTGTPACKNAEMLIGRFKAVKEALADTNSAFWTRPPTASVAASAESIASVWGPWLPMTSWSARCVTNPVMRGRASVWKTFPTAIS